MPPGAEQFERGNAHRFRADGDRDDNLLRAVACYKSALAVVPDRARTVVLLSLGHAYRERPRGSLEDLRQAAEYYWQAVLWVPADDPATLARARICLATTYLDMATSFQGAAGPDDIEDAIALLTAASQAPGLSPELHETALRGLGMAYAMRERGDRAANVEQALLYLNKALAAGGPPEPVQRIMLLVNIGRMYLMHLERAGGRRSDNVEAAIAALTEAERLLGSSADLQLPPNLARVQQTLGDAYAARMQGDPAANKEAALQHHRAAAAATEPGTPEWAAATGKVADDLIKRLRGEPSANLEEAIDLLRQILDVLDQHDFSWATTMVRLGSACRQRIAGDRAENIEQAIVCYKAALTVMTREESPLDWAQQQNNLGNAYAERLLGDRGDNLLQSAACLRSAVEAFGPSVLPQWSATLANLALTYEELASYGELDALRRAVECLEQALTVADRLDPVMRAMTQARLGQAVFRLTPDNPSALRQAMGYLQAALRVLTADSAPAYWARIMYDLGDVQLAEGDWDEAIRSLRAALTVWTREAMPSNWANTQLKLAGAYYMGGDYQLAEICLAPAAEVFRCLGDLKAWRIASVNLAEARADQGDWAGAVRAFGEAFDAAEASYGRLVLPASKEAELELAGTMRAAAAYAAVRVGDSGAATAARWLESGRARMLGDALARDRADLALLRQCDPAVAARFEAAVSEQRRLDAEPATPRDENLRPDLLRARDEARREGYRQVAEEYAAALAAARVSLGRPGFLTTDSPEEAGSASALLVYLAATRRGGLAVVLRGGAAKALDLPALTSTDLVPRVNRFLAASSSVSDAEAWRAEVDDVTAWLWAAGLKELADAVAGADIVTLVPCGALGVLPLHAAWQPDTSRPTGRRYLLDTAPVAYAPSARVLDACAPLARIPPDRLLAVADPQPVRAPRLRLAALEAAVAAARLPANKVLTSLEATVEAAANALRDASVAHFACHGRADLDDPGRSGLVLAHEQLLDARRIRAQQVRLRLAILSACETARPGTQLPDEVIGLPAALLQAGAGGVLAAWWPVPDDLALAVMLAFYERWDPASAASSPVTALAEAQQWLRDASNADIRGHLETLLDDPDNWLPKAVVQSCWENVVLQDPQERPFAPPTAWGAFGYYGR
jgi:CHAT domain-containing protein/tetratricopeptide (TPR) repeat protein